MSEHLSDHPQESQGSLPQGRKPLPKVEDFGRTVSRTITWVLLIVPLVLVVVVVALAMIGPSTGNIFSNIVNSL
jgi:hypothetical protein